MAPMRAGWLATSAFAHFMYLRRYARSIGYRLGLLLPAVERNDQISPFGTVHFSGSPPNERNTTGYAGHSIEPEIRSPRRPNLRLSWCQPTSSACEPRTRYLPIPESGPWAEPLRLAQGFVGAGARFSILCSRCSQGSSDSKRPLGLDGNNVPR